jgi:hypothetical protein
VEAPGESEFVLDMSSICGGSYKSFKYAGDVVVAGVAWGHWDFALGRPKGGCMSAGLRGIGSE